MNNIITKRTDFQIKDIIIDCLWINRGEELMIQRYTKEWKKNLG